VQHVSHGAIIGGRGVASHNTAINWWQGIPTGGRRVITQVLFTILVVVILLPLASLTGLLSFGSSHTSGGPVSGTTVTPAQHVNVPAHQTYNAQPPVSPSGATVELKLVTEEKLISISPTVAYHAWTFNGTVPGPILRVRQGQTVRFTLINSSNMPHSIDFHAAQTPWNVNYQPVAPGKSFSFTWKANYPGIFMYHCGTPPAMVHMANGMYGAIIVDPAAGWDAAQEYVLVQSEFYAQQDADGTYSLNGTSMMNAMPNFVTFNGYVNQYKDSPLTAKPGQKIRLFIVNAGPSLFSAFHVIGGIFSDVYVDGNPANHLQGDQTVTVPPGGGAVVELTIPDAGLYPFLTHSFSGADMGAIGVLKVAP
jgi:nitrite reductase (NO-forming)